MYSSSLFLLLVSGQHDHPLQVVEDMTKVVRCELVALVIPLPIIGRNRSLSAVLVMLVQHLPNYILKLCRNLQFRRRCYNFT